VRVSAEANKKRRAKGEEEDLLLNLLVQLFHTPSRRVEHWSRKVDREGFDADVVCRSVRASGREEKEEMEKRGGQLALLGED